MKSVLCLLATLLAGAGLRAGVVDVSSSQTVVVSGGDTLSFELFTGSYRPAAQKFGLPLDPQTIGFALVAASVDSGQQFVATLRTADASVSIGLDGALDFTQGYLSSAGAVSTLHGQFQLDPQLSRDLLAAGSVWLDLTNAGAEVSIGLAPLLLSQDLYGWLSSGGLSAGAVPGSVLLNHPEPAPRFSARGFAGGFQSNPSDPVPEPGTAGMLVGGGVLFLTFFGLWSGFRGSARNSKSLPDSAVCNKRIHSDTI